MSYRDIFKDSNYQIRERYDLALERIDSILQEETVDQPYREYFRRTASFILMAGDLFQKVDRDELSDAALDELKVLNHELYKDVLEENYQASYGNPAYAVNTLGEEFGGILSYLYTEIRGGIICAYEHRLFHWTICLELFIEIYNLFEEKSNYKKVQQAVYWFVHDYADVFVTYRIQEMLDPGLDFLTQIIMNSDLSDLRYLYAYGEYISENELKTAAYLNGLSQDDIEKMAATYTEGFAEGFKLAGVDLSKKKTVNIRYAIGFERMVKAAILQFEKMGLTPIIFRPAQKNINKQFEYDHRFDEALFLDKAMVERKAVVTRTAYETYKEAARVYAGPAVIETFGEKPSEPVNKKECLSLSELQQKLSVEYKSQISQITNQYIKREEYSFTIIAYPIPEIGDKYEEIFHEIVKVNTLDKELYKNIQQKIIDALDQAQEVHVFGKSPNETNICVKLPPIEKPESQTNFENCLADVNIPVGEVFTSPKLTGTSGVLHVSEVYLNDLKFINLKITFEDGMVKDYTCTNFDTEEENRSFVKENLMQNRDTLPLGEFAIGTNTTAYVMAHAYDIIYKLPILIVEKMGPHFAVGDTCYSHSEERRVYNPDGKEIVAKDNECSVLRKTDLDKAYFNCHTDITIPYEELDRIVAVKEDKTQIPIIENGRFVLEGTQKLNEPFDK